jgi:hypothetical protein
MLSLLLFLLPVVVPAWTVPISPVIGTSNRIPSTLWTLSSIDTTTTIVTTTTTTRLWAANGEEEEDEPSTVPPPRDQVNLVNQARYLNSIETLQREIAKAQGKDYTPPPDQVVVLGRFEVPLKIDSAPGLDLTETEYYYEEEDGRTNPQTTTTEPSEGGLVLVTSVTGNAAEAGLQALDTIVGVSCKATNPPFYVNVNSCDLPTTAQALQSAMRLALENNSKEIHLEMNRLITGYYGAEE